MQKSVQRQKKGFGWLVSSVLAVACAASSFSLLGKDAAAETTTYNYWHFTEGSGSYAVSLNSQAEGATSGYIGVETRVTRTDATVKNMGVMLNGAVAPLYTSGTTGKTIIYYDNGDMSAPTADAVVVTFTAMSDTTKQVSIIGTVRDERTYYTVALTDDITVQDGYALVNGKKTIGTAAITAEGSINGYTDDGLPMNPHRGAPYGGDASYYIGTDGIIYVSDWNKLADIDDEAFLSTSKANLAGSEYEERYTAEYAAEILSAFENGCTMTITWYGLQVNTVDFHIRAYTAYNPKTTTSTYQWIDGGNKELNQGLFGPAFYQKTNEVYKYKEYSLNELLGAYTFFPDAEKFNVWAFCDENGNNSSSTMLYKDNGTVSFTEDANMCVGGQYAGGWSTYPVYRFKVVDSTPEVTAREGVLAVKGVNYDLENFFDTRAFTGSAVTEITVDGVAVSGTYAFADGEEHVIVCKVTDGFSQSAQASLTLAAIEVDVPERVEIQAEEREKTYFAALPLPDGSTYTLALYNATDDTEAVEPYTTQRFYVFERSGEYKLIYTAYIQGAEEPMSFSTVYSVTVVKKAPEITVSGAYEESYFVGEAVTVISASANNGYEDFTVSFELFNGETSVKTGFGEYKFTAAGEYLAKYSVQMEDGRTVEKEFSFTVENDVEKPVIIVNGKYAAEYKAGDTVEILEAAAVDNTGEIGYTVSVYFNGGKTEVADKNIVLSAGTYKIVYSATDGAGNAAEEVTFEFTVKENDSGDTEEKKGCGKGCNSTVNGGTALIAGVIATLCLICLKRKSNNEEK